MADSNFPDALTKIKGCGRRYANIVAKKADIDLNLRCVMPRPQRQAVPNIST